MIDSRTAAVYLIERFRDDEVTVESVVADGRGLWHVDPQGHRSGPFDSLDDALDAHPALLFVGEVDYAEVTTGLVGDRALANRFDSPTRPLHDESPVAARPGTDGVEMFDLALSINGRAWYTTADGIRFPEGCDKRTPLSLYWEDEGRLDPGDWESLHRWQNVWFYAGSDAENCSTDRIWVDERTEYEVAMEALADAEVWFHAANRPPTLQTLQITSRVLDDTAVGEILNSNSLSEITEVTFNKQPWTCESGRWQPRP